jgi:transketolase
MGFESKSGNVEALIARSQWLRQSLFEMVMRKKAGHLPSSFSMVEILVSLYYGGVARVTRGDPKDPGRDRILVSKGHAAMAQYPILADYGFFPESELERFTEPGGLLGMYADFRIPGIEGISGSLGHGVGMGAGIALAARNDGHAHRAFIILGDGENYEGSIWESAMFAAHHRLDNLVVIVDRNQLCILGRTEELLQLGDLEAKWRSFGWEAATVNGHSYKSLLAAFEKIGDTGGKPYVIIADTVKGKGVSFMEGRAEWHNRMPDDALIAQARADLSHNSIID